MEHYQFGFVLTIALDTDQDSKEAAEEWAEAEANKIIERINAGNADGVQLRVPMLVHPNHVLKVEQAIEKL